MKKNFALVLFLFFTFVRPSFAASRDFLIDENSSYTINSSGIASVVEAITIKNTTDYLFTPTYTLHTGLQSVNSVKVMSNTGQSIPFEIVDDSNGLKSVDITFLKRVTGKTKTNNFTISYTTNSIAKKIGNVWQVSIPGTANHGEFEQYIVSVTAPISFGSPSISKPYKTSIPNDGINYHIQYTTLEMNASGVFLEFGSHQNYTFHLTYRLANPNFFSINAEMALPPSTNYQDITIGKISPKPSTVRLDEDGNWIAMYKLNVGQKLTVTVDGNVTVFPTPKPESLSANEIQTLTRSQKYWETGDSDIQNLAKKLKTPEKIYTYVRDKLTYDYTKVGKNNNRLGAKGVLANPKEAVCLEFTDLFIAIARAAGIPTRGIEGYGYTDNPTLKPISQVNDILHTWPEYYDQAKKTWIMVDPTWGNTSLGSDYFHSMDFEHIVFVLHGQDSTYPIPAGGYKYAKNSKDVDVSVAINPQTTSSVHGQLVDTLPSYALFGLPVYGNLVVENTGNSLLRNVSVEVTSGIDGKEHTYTVSKVAPFGSENLTINLGLSPFLTNRNYTITIVSGTSQIKHQIHVGFIPQKELVIIGGVTIVGIAALLIIATKTRRLFV